MKKKLLFFACLLLLGGVSSAWATVTATFSGMNKVGDYYYPIYKLSESASISSYTSSNGAAPATIDGITLTFSHRGTVTLSDGTVVEGKKYSATVYDFTAKPSSIKSNTADDGIWGFTTQGKYHRWQWNSSIAKNGSNSELYSGLTITNTGTANSLYLNYYYTDENTRYGMQLNSSSGKVTVNNGATIARLDYYDNHSADNSSWTGTSHQYPTTDLTLSNYKKVEWVTGDNPEFTLHERTYFYLYETLTTYTEVAESLTEATATLTGFAETSSYYYPVYTITATHDEDGTVNPTLTDGEGFDVATNVLTYTERTASETNVTITYGGVNTTVEVPASVKYKKTNYDLGAEATYSATLTNNGSGIPGFSDSATRKLIGTAKIAGEYINGMNFAASQYGYFVSVGYGMTNNDNKKTANITISDMTDCYAVLTHKEGANSDSPTWASKDEVAESPVADVEGTITLSIRNKNNDSNGWDIPYVYTDIDIYQPVLATIVGTYSLNESSFTASDGKYYRQYTINATKDDTDYNDFTVTVKSGSATVTDKTVTYTGTETATVTLTDDDGSDTTYDLELPTSVAYLLTNNYNFGLKSTYPSSIISANNKAGAVNGFNASNKTRYFIGVQNTTPAAMFDNITLGFARWGWIGYEDNSNTFGIQFVAENVGSTTSTIKFSNAIAGQVAVLNYTVGNNSDNDGKGTNWSARVMQADVMTASSSDITFTVHDRGVLETTGKGYVYTSLQVYTPVSLATQSVTVNSGINMGTLVAPYPLDFSDNEGIKAYTATGLSGSAVRFTRINKVPANTPVLIYKDGGATSDISFVNAEETDTPDASNMLKAGTGAAVATTPAEGTTNYILSKSRTEEVYGFFYANGAEVPATKAYLQVKVTDSASSRLSVIFDDQETTGIGHVESKTTKDATIYNLNGQRVNAPAKGLYIVNGKKIIIK
ncbi:MAG: hypothetical protein J6I52_10185 [Prevotella sp.]|nr:hypothetical protein [Prevotella sp.]